MNDRFFTIWFAIAFTLVAVSMFDGISVIAVRAIGAGMVFGFIPLVEIGDAIKRRHDEYVTRLIMRRGAESARRYGI